MRSRGRLLRAVPAIGVNFPPQTVHEPWGLTAGTSRLPGRIGEIFGASVPPRVRVVMSPLSAHISSHHRPFAACLEYVRDACENRS